MKTVLLIGAGATRGEALSRGASKAQRPPLDGDFFELSEQHGLQAHRSRVDAFVREHFDRHIFRHPRPTMEEVFGLVYASTLVRPVPEQASSAFSSLCRIYAGVLASTTNWLSPTRKGPLCRLLHGVLSEGNVTILTFNQDIVIEKALRLLSDKDNSPAVWYPKTGYGLDFAGYTSPTRGGDTLANPSQPPVSNPIVLKPHGSLNWYARTLRDDRVLSQLRKDQKMFCTLRLALQTSMKHTTGKGQGRRRWHTWPIIVPPIFEKGTFLSAAFESLWQKAWDALIQADRIVVYGYSFPPADAQSRSFFLRAAAKRRTSPVLVTINPDMVAAQRAQEIFSPPIHLLSASVATYLRDATATALTAA
jgi:hypothetical protein